LANAVKPTVVILQTTIRLEPLSYSLVSLVYYLVCFFTQGSRNTFGMLLNKRISAEHINAVAHTEAASKKVLQPYVFLQIFSMNNCEHLPVISTITHELLN